MRKNSLFALLAFIVLGFFLVDVSLAAAQVPTPQIYQVVDSADNSRRPWVIGWTPNQVAVEVMMDGQVVGDAKVVKDDSGTASFGWAPQQDLELGFHEFRVRGVFAEKYSEPGGVIGYNVRPKTPAPVLTTPEQFEDYVLIKGLVPNDHSVKIYIDGWLAADFLVPNHPSGTTNFWFKARGLLNGVHEVYALAYDQTGKLSKRSQSHSFKTEQQKITKGEEMEEEREENQENSPVDMVIDEPVEGEVNITSEPETGEVMVEENLEEGKVMIEENEISEEEQAEESGEISTASEEFNEEEENDEFARAEQNRYIGLIILAIVVVALLAWYWQEKKKLDEKEEKEENKDL